MIFSSCLRQPSKRCDIADHLYKQAKAKGAVPPGIGWLPWATTPDSNGIAHQGADATTATEGRSKKDDDSEVKGGRADAGSAGSDGAAASSTPGVFGWDGKHGYGRESEEERVSRESDPARLLSDAVGFYRLAAQLEEGGGGTGRGLFSLGWMHQASFREFGVCLFALPVSSSYNLAALAYNLAAPYGFCLGILIRGILLQTTGLSTKRRPSLPLLCLPSKRSQSRSK